MHNKQRIMVLQKDRNLNDNNKNAEIVIGTLGW